MGWIARCRCLVLFALIAITAASQGEPRALEAWWLNANFPANLSVYEGLDVSTLDPNWAKMGVMAYSDLPAEARDDLQWMHRGRFVFSTEGNLSGRGFHDRAVAGVFVARDGTEGRFLLVLRRARDGTWRKLFIHEERGERGFSVLVVKGGKIYWGTCMQCEDFRRLVVGQGGATLE